MLTPAQRTALATALAAYGARLTDDGHIARGDKVLGVSLEIRKGRLRMLGGQGLIASFPASDLGAGVSAFVERFWYWTKLEPCPTCKGSGCNGYTVSAAGGAPAPCHACKGSGKKA